MFIPLEIKKKNSWQSWYYPHWSRDSVSPVCGIFTESAPLSRFSHRVAVSLCFFVSLFVCLCHCVQFFWGLSLALSSHDQFEASHRSSLPLKKIIVGAEKKKKKMDRQQKNVWYPPKKNWTKKKIRNGPPPPMFLCTPSKKICSLTFKKKCPLFKKHFWTKKNISPP